MNIVTSEQAEQSLNPVKNFFGFTTVIRKDGLEETVVIPVTNAVNAFFDCTMWQHEADR
jgi:hypothetical protein